MPPKNTVSKTKAAKATSAKNKAEKMEAPWIMTKSQDGWRALYGHCCTTKAEMEEYIQMLDPNGYALKIMDLSKVKIDKAGRVVEEVVVEEKPKKKM